MDDIEEFIEEFRKNEDVEGLLSRKEYFRKVKYRGGAIVVGVYMIWTGLIVIAPDFVGRHPNLALGTIIAPAIIIIIILLILYIDIRKYNSTSEEIAYHEFAQAIDAYCSEPPDYQEWKNHLINVYNVIFYQDADIFSQSRRYTVLKYIQQIRDRDINDKNDTYFEDFYKKILYPLLMERKNDFEDILHELEQEKSTTQGFLSTLFESGENIIKDIGSKTWAPTAMILGIMAAIAVVSELTYGFYFAIVSFTVLEYLRGGKA